MNADRHVEIEQDGRTLVGREWITPEDFVDDDVANGRLPSLKGSTPTTLPSLDRIEITLSRSEPWL